MAPSFRVPLDVVALFAFNLTGDNDSLSGFALCAVPSSLAKKIVTKDESVNSNKFTYYKEAHTSDSSSSGSEVSTGNYPMLIMKCDHCKSYDALKLGFLI